MNNLMGNIVASSIVLLAFVVLVVIVYYFKNLGVLKKRKEHFENLHNQLKVGCEVSFGNGLYGKIKALDTEFADIEIKSGGVIKVSRYAISDIIK